MTVIKFCGFTSSLDLEFAASLGVDFVGIVLVKSSKRYVSFQRAKELIDSINGPKKVAVLKNPELSFAKKLLDIGFDFLQLHGSEDISLIEKVGKRRVIKAFGTCEGFKLPDWSYEVFGILLDACEGGGSARLANWSMALEIARAHPRVFLAGGLNPENVSRAIKEVRPFGVDVSSGIESSFGVKDFEKMKSFIRGVAGGISPRAFD
ncbi:MAG: phosphoribosylanthranilate isomerase [Aquificaceae bacterium]